MKTFRDISNKTFYFSSCNTCEAQCCDGRKGSVFAQIILEDFEEVYKNFPILFIFGELGYLKPVMLISDGKNFCPHIKDNKCTIYEQRPSICKAYPLSPNVDKKIYIDENCPAVSEVSSEESSVIVKEGKISKTFFAQSLDGYQDKYIQTHFELEQINKKEDFEVVTTINGINFYKYTGTLDNLYIQYHKDSLLTYSP